MLQALLRGKLSRDHEQIEDIVTSNVFGVLKYDDPGLTLEFLSRAILSDGRKALDFALLRGGGISIKWEFWPYWSEAGRIECEPDVVLSLEDADGSCIQVLIEAKLNSGKSSLADDGPTPSDQLAREWDNLSVRARTRNAQPLLIYLTSHFSFPRFEIEDSLDEFQRKRGSTAAIAWLSWRELRSILDLFPSNPIRDDLRLLLERMGLTYFEGVFPVTPLEIGWRFHAGKYDWNVAKVDGLDWRFE